jgi:hypothetical protein
MRTGAHGAGERDPTSARWMVLVDEHIMSEEDLTQKYGPMFAASRHNAFQAGPSPIPSQHRLTQQLTKQWPQFETLRPNYACTRFEEQRQLHLPQKHKATVPESTLRVEMNRLEEQADNAKACDFFWKPLSWLGTIRPSSANDAFDPALWTTFSPRR